ncbi:hypothetical protein MMC29_001377 [Sticta canariensis]|nr:hypothetical protein [Sticta canariensis]
MKYILQLISRSTALAVSSSSSSSPFHQPTKRREDTAISKTEEKEHQFDGQPTTGPSAGNDLQLNALLAESFRNVRTPLVETNEEGNVVVDSSVCYDMNCQICEPMQECPALLRTLERVLTDNDGSIVFPFRQGTPTVEADPLLVEDSGSPSNQEDEGREQAYSPEAGQKEKTKEKGHGGRRFSGWSKLCTRLPSLFRPKSAAGFST